MADLGGLLATKEASVLGNYYAMVFEWNHLSKDVKGLEKDHKRLNANIKKHNIEEIKKNMDEIDEKILKSEKEGYKLGYRDLLLLRRGIINLRLLSQSVHENMEAIEKLDAQIGQKVGDKKIRNKFLKELKEAKDIDEFSKKKVGELIAEAHGEMQGEQKAVFDLEATGKGKIASGLILKGEAGGSFRHLQIRWGALRTLKKGLRAGFKGKEGVLGAFKRTQVGLKRQLEEIDTHHAELKDIKKGIITEEKQLRLIRKKLDVLFENIENVIKASYKIFIFDLMLLKEVVRILFSEEEQDKKLILQHEIPQRMGYEDIQTLEKDKKVIHEHLQNLEKFLLQLWNLAKS